MKLTFIKEPICFFNLKVVGDRIQNSRTAWYGNFNQTLNEFCWRPMAWNHLFTNWNELINDHTLHIHQRIGIPLMFLPSNCMINQPYITLCDNCIDHHYLCLKIEDKLSTFHVCMLIILQISMIMAYNDQLLSVMSNQHVELYKCMILAQYLTLSQQNQYISVLNLNTFHVLITSQSLYMCITL